MEVAVERFLSASRYKLIFFFLLVRFFVQNRRYCVGPFSGRGPADSKTDQHETQDVTILPVVLRTLKIRRSLQAVAAGLLILYWQVWDLSASSNL